MITDDVRGVAFRRLLRTRVPVMPDQLADDLHQPDDQVHAAIDTLHGQGLIRLDAVGHVIGPPG